jgi:hypothetical protein
MDMIGHQHITKATDFCSCTGSFQQLELISVIIIGEKHTRAAIATLVDMVGDVENDNAGKSGHREKTSRERGESQ